jgi:hypothetical protein
VSGPTASSIACVNCGRFMKPVKNGQVVEELTTRGDPYRIWASDEYGCTGCDTRVVIGFSRLPIAEHFQEEAYARAKARVAYQLR